MIKIGLASLKVSMLICSHFGVFAGGIDLQPQGPRSDVSRYPQCCCWDRKVVSLDMRGFVGI